MSSRSKTVFKVVSSVFLVVGGLLAVFCVVFGIVSASKPKASAESSSDIRYYTTGIYNVSGYPNVGDSAPYSFYFGLVFPNNFGQYRTGMSTGASNPINFSESFNLYYTDYSTSYNTATGTSFSNYGWSSVPIQFDALNSYSTASDGLDRIYYFSQLLNNHSLSTVHNGLSVSSELRFFCYLKGFQAFGHSALSYLADSPAYVTFSYINPSPSSYPYIVNTPNFDYWYSYSNPVTGSYCWYSVEWFWTNDVSGASLADSGYDPVSFQIIFPTVLPFRLTDVNSSDTFDDVNYSDFTSSTTLYLSSSGSDYDFERGYYEGYQSGFAEGGTFGYDYGFDVGLGSASALQSSAYTEGFYSGYYVGINSNFEDISPFEMLISGINSLLGIEIANGVSFAMILSLAFGLLLFGLVVKIFLGG